MTGPLVFLDIDGVIRRQDDKGWVEPRINRKLVGRLNEIIRRSGARIVLSTSWRDRFTKTEMLRLFREYGIHGKIVGKTPRLEGRERGDEIAAWIKKHKFTGSYVVLDDRDDMSAVAEHLVQTKRKHGLRDRDVRAAVQSLR